MRHILFVDDESNVLDGIRRMLHPQRDKWQTAFALSGKEALAYLSTHSVDAIVTDMRMPQMNGAQLLASVRQLHPSIIRFILSGHADRELIIQSVGSAHRYLAKPCDLSTLVAALEHSFSIQQLVSDERIRQMVLSIGSLPLLPTTYKNLLSALGNESSTVDSIAGIVSRDVGLSAKILHLINSAFFGLPTHVDKINRAVSLLGLETIRSLALTAGVFEQFVAEPVHGLTLEDIYSHCLLVGNTAARVARHLRLDKPVVDESLLAGMMHDVGKALMVTHMRPLAERAVDVARERGVRLQLVEREVVGVTHAELGGYLLSLWGESHSTVEAVLLHHQPSMTTTVTCNALTAVHIANALTALTEYSDHEQWASQELDSQYLSQLGILDTVRALAEQQTDVVSNGG